MMPVAAMRVAYCGTHDFNVCVLKLGSKFDRKFQFSRAFIHVESASTARSVMVGSVV